MTTMLRAGDRERELEVVTIDELNVDHRYQRDLNQTLVEKILMDWDFLAADVLTVSRRDDDTLWIINGQHRAAAAKLAGETEALAFVYAGLTVREEADLRLKANNRRSDTPLERFHAQVEAGRPDSVVILKMCEEFDTHVNRTNNSKSGINCVSALEAVYRADEGLLLRNTLKLLQDAYGEIRGEVAQEPVIRGLAWFLRQHSTEVQRADLRSRMSRVGVEDVLRKARSHKAAMGGSMWINFYRALVETYNYRRAETHRLEWRTKHKNVLDESSTFGSRQARPVDSLVEVVIDIPPHVDVSDSEPVPATAPRRRAPVRAGSRQTKPRKATEDELDGRAGPLRPALPPGSQSQEEV